MPRTPYDVTIRDGCHFIGSGLDETNQVPSWRYTETFSGVSRRKPKGFIPATPYSYFFRSISNAKGSCVYKFPGQTLNQQYYGVVGGGTGVHGAFPSSSHFDAAMLETSVDSSIDNRALIKARNGLKGQSINLGVAFAERNRTARLVGDTASNIAKSFRDLRRGRIRSAMDRLGISSSHGEPRGSNVPRKWLELQYGWKPLLSDVYGACHRLENRDLRDWLVTSKARAFSNYLNVVKFTGMGAGTLVARREDRVFVRIDGGPDNDPLGSLASLGALNPLLVGWELVPFSFVVDWFLPIGGWVESLDSLLGFKVLSYSSSHITRSSWDGVGENYTNLPFRYENSYQENKRTVRLVRTAGTSVPLARFPSFKDPRSLEHMANGLSLLAVVFGQKR